MNKPSDSPQAFTCPQVTYSPELVQYLAEKRAQLVKDGIITERMAKFMQQVEADSSENLCNLLKGAVQWDPRVGEVINQFLESHSKTTLEGHLHLKDEFEIARSLDGFAIDSAKEALMKGLPSEFVNRLGTLDDSKTKELIALAKFIQDLRENLGRVGPEFYYHGSDNSYFQEARVEFETARGLFNKGEYDKWTKTPENHPYPFSTSGVLRARGKSKDHRVILYNPIVIYLGIKNLMDRSIFTFMDAMLPPLLTKHRLSILKEPDKFSETLPKGYICDRSGLEPSIELDELETLGYILDRQHLALPEALAVSWGVEHLPSESIDRADYVEAQIFGNLNLDSDIEKIYTTKNIVKWIKILIKEEYFKPNYSQMHNLLVHFINSGKFETS